MKNQQSAVTGARLYVAAATIMDALYVDITRDIQPIDASLIAERKRQHKRLWMRLTRGDALFARAAAIKMQEKSSPAPFDAQTRRQLDREIVGRLVTRIGNGELFPTAPASEGAKALLADITALLDQCEPARAPESRAA